MRVPWFVVLVVLGSGLACSPVASGDDEAGVTTNHGSTSTDTTESSEDASADGWGAGDDPVKLDIPVIPDPILPDFMQVDECTTTFLTWDEVSVAYPDCTLVPGGNGCGSEAVIGCTPPGPSGCNCPEGDCIGTWSVCTGDTMGWDEMPNEICGPFVVDGLCCSIGEFNALCGE